MHVDTHDLLRRYLLGQVSESTRERIDEQLMTDAALMEELRAEEEELADEYAADLLSAADKEGFETTFLAHPTRQQQVRFARAFRKYTQSHSESHSHFRSDWAALLSFLRSRQRVFQLAFGAASAVVVVGFVLLLFQVITLQRQLRTAGGDRASAIEAQKDLARTLAEQRKQNENLQDQLANSKRTDSGRGQTAGPLSFRSFSLMPGVVRDAGSLQRVELSPDSVAARLELVLENSGYTSYDASLQSPDGSQIWSQKGLREVKSGSGPTVVLLVSRDVFKPGDYLLKLNGVAGGRSEPVGTYYFRVPK
jgi:hypothetical protein